MTLATQTQTNPEANWVGVLGVGYNNSLVGMMNVEINLTSSVDLKSVIMSYYYSNLTEPSNESMVLELNSTFQGQESTLWYSSISLPQADRYTLVLRLYVTNVYEDCAQLPIAPVHIGESRTEVEETQPLSPLVYPLDLYCLLLFASIGTVTVSAVFLKRHKAHTL
jgi:hypothetical protein